MGVEACNISDNTFSGLDIQLPSELKDKVLSETHISLVDCFIDSLSIQAGSELFKSIFMAKLRDFGMQEFRVISVNGGVLDSGYIDDILYQAVQEYYEVLPEGSILDPKVSYLVINGVSINYSHIIKADSFNYGNQGLSSQIRSNAPQEGVMFSWDGLEPGGGFQRNKDIPYDHQDNLSSLIEDRGFPQSLIPDLSTLFGRDLNPYEIQSLELLVRYIATAESYGGFNFSHDPGFPGSGGYFEYQKNDGRAGKEVYDFATQTFTSMGDWNSGDREIKIVSGNSRQWVRKVWNKSSYDMALSRIPLTLLEKYPQLQEEFNNIGKPQDQDMSALSAELQILVLISDLYASDLGEPLFRRILKGDKNAISELYRHVHHADLTNPKTQELVAKLNKTILKLT